MPMPRLKYTGICRAIRSRHVPAPRRLGSTLSSPTPLRQQQQHHQQTPIDFTTLLSRPTWSVRTLLPSSVSDAAPPSSSSSSASSSSSSSSTDTSSPITPALLAHLHNLSALPRPATAAAATAAAETLEAQLHFVRAIQAVDTAGVEPLAAIRDETAGGRREQTVTLETLASELARETRVGRAQRPRRRRRVDSSLSSAVDQDQQPDQHHRPDWDVFGAAKRRAGSYFVVKTAA